MILHMWPCNPCQCFGQRHHLMSNRRQQQTSLHVLYLHQSDSSMVPSHRPITGNLHVKYALQTSPAQVNDMHGQPFSARSSSSMFFAASPHFCVMLDGLACCNIRWWEQDPGPAVRPDSTAVAAEARHCAMLTGLEC